MNATTRTIPFIPGDGIGPEIMDATRQVIDASVRQAYDKDRLINWLHAPAGQEAFQSTGAYLPDSTIGAIQKHQVAIKGPLTTPVGGGIRSLNVFLRQMLDLYVCQRPVRWVEGLPSPHRSPRGINLVVFRENVEDLYAGIEYQPGTKKHKAWMQSFQSALPDDFRKIPHPNECGIGIKPVSESNSRRLVHAALDWAIKNKRHRVTLVHKGNIMKFTEGAFLNWGYVEAHENFNAEVFTRRQLQRAIEKTGEANAEQIKTEALENGKIWLDDVIADVAFEQLITCPQDFDVIATTNLNGDYLSDAAAALTGGIGISPGANINYTNGTALFEANHGSAPDIADKDKANPSSLILSGVMMLRFMGWHEPATVLQNGLMEAIRQKRVTFDIASKIENPTTLGTQAFANEIISNIKKET